MKITDTVTYVGVNDHKIDLFEGQYNVPNGIAYNSYLIMDEKIAVMDTVDADFRDEWLYNLDKALKGQAPDYLIVQHMEPDHSSNITYFMNKYSSAKIVASAKAFDMIKSFFGIDYSDRAIVVGENSELTLGKRTLKFFTAPMVHWPEVIVTYDTLDKILFSADGFGKFGALDVEEDWDDEAARYYIGIVGKYGVQVQALLKKLSGLEILKICSLHGPVLSENLEHYINLYNIWSSYQNEKQGVVICYTSIYKNTKRAVELLAEKLKANGKTVIVNDLARCDTAKAVSDAFRYDTVVLATTTYNGDIFPAMRSFIDHLTKRNFQNKKIAFIENGSWASVAAKTMKAMLENSKNLTFAENTVTLKSALNEANIEQIEALVNEL